MKQVENKHITKKGMTNTYDEMMSRFAEKHETGHDVESKKEDKREVANVKKEYGMGAIKAAAKAKGL